VLGRSATEKSGCFVHLLQMYLANVMHMNVREMRNKMEVAHPL